jgi:hypothetical protein
MFTGEYRLTACFLSRDSEYGQRDPQKVMSWSNSVLLGRFDTVAEAWDFHDKWLFANSVQYGESFKERYGAAVSDEYGTGYERDGSEY